MGQGTRCLDPSWVVLPTLAGTGEVMWAPLPLQFGGGKGRRPGGMYIYVCMYIYTYIYSLVDEPKNEP